MFYSSMLFADSTLTDSAITLTSSETHIRIHSQRIQKRGTERAQGSVKEGQIVRQAIFVAIFRIHKECILSIGVAWPAFIEFLSFYSKNPNC